MSGAGKDFLLQIGDGDVSEEFVTIGGLRSTKMSFSASEIDKSHVGSAQWTEIADGAGIRKVSVSGSGTFTGSATEVQMQTDAFAQTLRHFRVVDVVTNKYVQAKFKITSLEDAGEYNGERTWSISLSSSGVVTIGTVS